MKKLGHLFIAMILIVSVSVSALGTSTRSSAFLDKTRFVADVGIAYFCFHRWVSKPFHAGAFQAGAPHRTKSIIKAGGALLFAVNRVKAASRLAHHSKDKLLQRLAGGLDAMGASFGSIGSRLKQGKFNPADMQSLDSSYSTFNGSAAANGLQIKDKAVAIPGL